MLGIETSVLIARAVVLIIAFTFHEFAHAWTATYFGDTLPREQGRLTLNPLKHLDPLGSLLLLISGFGWARPVQINPVALAQAAPSALMWVALAGPLSNLLLALVGAIPFQLGLVEPTLAAAAGLPSAGQLMTEFVWINVILLFFNLLPIFPLDGEKVLMYFLPEAGKALFRRIRSFGGIILMLLVFALPSALNVLIGLPAGYLMRLLVQ